MISSFGEYYKFNRIITGGEKVTFDLGKELCRSNSPFNSVINDGIRANILRSSISHLCMYLSYTLRDQDYWTTV